MEPQNNSTVEYGARRVILTLTVILCAMLELIDTSIVNVALTTLMGNLGATLGEVSWVVAAYGIANVIVVPMSGWLSSNFGRKNYYTGSVLLFTFASLMCANSTNIWELVFWRFVQGLGGGALLATAQAILVDIYPREKMGMASAMFGMGVIVGPTLGPTLGGYLVDNFEWPMIFQINIPLGIIAAILTYTFLRNSPTDGQNKGQKVDWLGIGLLIVGVGSLQMVLEQGERESWFESSFIVKFTVVAIVGVIGFIWRELTVEYPIVDLKVLTKGNVGIGTVLSFILGFVLFSTVFVLPVFAQRFLGFTAMQTGMLFLPGAFLAGMCMPIVGISLSKGAPAKLMVAAGFTITAAFCWWTSTKMSPTSSEADFFWPLIVRGLGMGLLFVPLTNMALGGLSGRDVASASGLTSMMRQLGGAFGVAIMSMMTEIFSAQHRADLAPNLSLLDNETNERLSQVAAGMAARGGAAPTQQAYAYLEFQLGKQSMLLTYIDLFQYITIFVLCIIPLVFIAKTYKMAGKPDMGAH